MELQPLGLFRFSLHVMGIEQVTSGFYDLFERDDKEMAERGFQIQEDLLLHFCRLVFPPGARVKSQTTKSEVKKTKEAANL